MGIGIGISDAAGGGGGGPVPPPFPPDPAPWIRPPDWPDLPVITPGDQIFAGLFAVFPENPNYVALVANVADTGRAVVVVPNANGAGYLVGNTLSINDTDVTVTVTSIVNGGYVGASNIPDGGSGYTPSGIFDGTLDGGNGDTVLQITVDEFGVVSGVGNVVSFGTGGLTSGTYDILGDTGSGAQITIIAGDGVPTALSVLNPGTNATVTENFSTTTLTGAGSDLFVSITEVAVNNYTVDWGDGTVEDFDGGVTAEHAYDFDTLDTEFLPQLYKTAIITVTPQAGSDLTFLELHYHSTPGNEPLAWLDCEVNSLALTAFHVTGNWNSITPMLEHVYLGQNAIEDASDMFYANNDGKIQSFDILELNAATDCNGLCNGQTSVRSIVLPNLPLCTTLYNAFYGCTALEKAVIGDCPLLEDGTYVFEACSALKVSEWGQLGSSDNYLAGGNMYSGCLALTHVIFGDITTDMTGDGDTVFLDSASPLYLHYENISGNGTLDFNQVGIDNPYLLEYIKIGNLPDATSLNSMCYDLEGLRIFEMGDAPLCEDFSSAWGDLASLQSWVAGDMSAATTMVSAFVGLDADGAKLKLVLGDFPNCTAWDYCFSGKAGLEELVLGNIQGDASFTSVCQNTYNLRKITVGNILGTTFPTELFSSAPAVQEIVCGDGLEVDGVTLSELSAVQTIALGTFPAATYIDADTCPALTSLTVVSAAAMNTIQSSYDADSSLIVAPLLDSALIENAAVAFENNAAMQSIPEIDLSAATTIGAWVTGCVALSSCDAFGAKVDISFENCNFGVDGLVNVFEKLGALSDGSGAILETTTDDVGSGYTDSDVVTLLGGDGNATVQLTVVDGSITALTLTNPGTGYTNGESCATSGGTGTGLAFTVYTIIPATITVTGNPGTPYLTAAQKAIAEDKGWTVVTS